MRPLPDLTDLQESPSVFSQPTDDWNGIFANEFAGMASEQAGADQEQTLANAGMDPISQGIDALSSALDLAGNILDILSGDLDAVNLDPVIQDFQAQDAALDYNLSNPSFDFAAAGVAFLNAFGTIAGDIYTAVIDAVQPILNNIISLIDNALSELEIIWQSIF